MDALEAFETPFQLIEATARFKNVGAPMQLLLAATPGVYVVALGVSIAGKAYDHAIVVCTHPSEHAPLGKLINNTGLPLYIEPGDLVHKVPAKKAFKKLLTQKIGHDSFSAHPKDMHARPVRRAQQLERRRHVARARERRSWRAPRSGTRHTERAG